MNVISVKRERAGERVGRESERERERMVDLFIIKSRSRSANWRFNIQCFKVKQVITDFISERKVCFQRSKHNLFFEIPPRPNAEFAENDLL